MYAVQFINSNPTSNNSLKHNNGESSHHVTCCHRQLIKKVCYNNDILLAAQNCLTVMMSKQLYEINVVEKPSRHTEPVGTVL